MLSTDTFRARFEMLTVSLRAWTGFIADVAKVETADSDVAWRFALTPRSPEACPVELLLRRDQSYDIAIGPQTYEDQPLDDTELFQPLLEAITEGRVVTRTRRSHSTGALHSIETRVMLDGGRLWNRLDSGPLASSIGPETTLTLDRHYTPYRR